MAECIKIRRFAPARPVCYDSAANVKGELRMMRYATIAVIGLLVLGSGCARSRASTGGFESVDSVTVGAGYDETWQATKAVLREMELEIYTRDKSGEFVAYSPMRRQFRVVTPRRAKFTIRLEELGAESTNVSVEYVEQVYGVTPLTYPDWHDRESVDNSVAISILEAVRNRVG
jgi:hypothetical protein